VIELFIWKYGLYILIIYGFIANACTTPSKVGYWEDDKPWRGTIQANKFNKNPYWQCVGFNRNVFCDE